MIYFYTFLEQYKIYQCYQLSNQTTKAKNKQKMKKNEKINSLKTKNVYIHIVLHSKTILSVNYTFVNKILWLFR